MTTRVYKVAGHCFAVMSNLPEMAGLDLFTLMDNYEPFAVPSVDDNVPESPLFAFAVVVGLPRSLLAPTEHFTSMKLN